MIAANSALKTIYAVLPYIHEFAATCDACFFGFVNIQSYYPLVLTSNTACWIVEKRPLGIVGKKEKVSDY